MTGKQRRRGGFTTLEMLMAMLIMLLAGGVVLGGLPAAIEAYNKVIDFANAQVLLSSTMTRLRDEIGTARMIPNSDDISDDDPGIYYTNARGNSVRIYYDADRKPEDSDYKEEAPGLYLEYREESPTRVSPLASNGVTPRNLAVNYDTATFVSDENAPDYGLMIISNLRVERRRGATVETLASSEKFQIRVLSYVKHNP